LNQCDLAFVIANNSMKIHKNCSEPWKVTAVDTGEMTLAGERIKRVSNYIKNQTFLLTYEDGVGNINLKNLLSFHKQHGKLATVTSTQPVGRFETLTPGRKQYCSFFPGKACRRRSLNQWRIFRHGTRGSSEYR
jgi:glucose-1-phosphate cytidylyltransferase